MLALSPTNPTTIYYNLGAWFNTGGKVVGFAEEWGRRVMDRTDADRIKEAFERLAVAVQDSYEAAAEGAAEGAASMRQANFRLTRSVLQSNTELLRAQAEIQADLNRRTLESMAEQARRHRKPLLKLSRGSVDAYDGFLGSLSSYYEELSRETGEPGN